MLWALVIALNIKQLPAVVGRTIHSRANIMANGISDVKKKKKSAFSCEGCRRRKVKCAGEKPQCSRCVARSEVCVYHLAPTISYTQKLEARVQELERAAAGSQTTQSPSTLPRSEPSPRVPTFEGVRPASRDAITYQSSTSFFELVTGHGSSALPVTQISNHLDSRRERLVENAEKQRSRELLAATPEPFKFMLSNHWCWIQPLFNFIYRPAFTRDMQVLGPYYSHTLLNAVLAHSARWCSRDPAIAPLLEPYDQGRLFSRHARTMLFEEVVAGKGTVPLVQTLLMLSAQECGAGNATQAWLYSGMAFRYIQDMGICVDNEIYATQAHLSEEDLEIRNRLFWSCYFWDKIICLYLGRSPSLKHTRISPPQMLLDDSAEDEIWVPHGLTYPSGQEYPKRKSHATSCFMQMCKLSVIFHQILLHMYDREQDHMDTERQQCVEDQGTALNIWWEDLPEHLKIDPISLPAYAPPSHIITLNCLYHTFSILLYRPMVFGSTSLQLDFALESDYLKKCIASANAIVFTVSLNMFLISCLLSPHQSLESYYSHCTSSLTCSVEHLVKAE